MILPQWPPIALTRSTDDTPTYAENAVLCSHDGWKDDNNSLLYKSKDDINIRQMLV